MSTLGLYKQKVIEKIAQAATTFHTNAARTSAINEALQNLTEAYDIPETYKKAMISFTSGVADKPADYFRMIKLYTFPAANQQPQEYTYLVEDLFDDLAPDAQMFNWTEDYDIITGDRKFYIVADDTVDLQIRYVKKMPTLVNDGDDSGLTNNFDDVVAYWAGYILLRQEGNYAKAAEYERKARDICVTAIQSKRKQGGVKQGERVRSRFEKFPILNQGSIGGN